MGERVARYYDANTWRFLLVGPGRSARTIHRELWGPGVSSRAEAAEYVHHLIAAEIERAELGRSFRLVDLGCGVGGTVLRLAELWPEARLVGVTISARQVEHARRLAETLEVGERCSFALGDFQTADVGSGFDVAVAIESFVHAAAPDRFFEAAFRALRGGGRLIVVDDFLVRPTSDLDVGPRRLVDDFRSGGRIPSLCTRQECRLAASAAGFRGMEDVDLTPLIRTGRPRDRVIALLAPLFRALGLAGVPFFGNMIGGDALQRGLRQGLVRYRMQVWRKPERTD